MRRVSVWLAWVLAVGVVVTCSGVSPSSAVGLHKVAGIDLRSTGSVRSHRPSGEVVGVLPGYVLAAADGGVFAFGRAFHGSAAGLSLQAPIVGIASTPDRGGYWLVAADGGVFAYGDARFYGSMAGVALNDPVVGIASTPDGGGYWLVASDGGVFAFGDAQFFGRRRLLAPIAVGMATTGDGNGYWLLTDEGQVFPYGDAPAVLSPPFTYGYAAIARIAGTVHGIVVVHQDGTRYTFDAKDAGCVPIARFVGPMNPATWVVGAATVAPHCGEWLAGSDGGVFAYGAPFVGSAANLRLATRIVGIAS